MWQPSSDPKWTKYGHAGIIIGDNGDSWVVKSSNLNGDGTITDMGVLAPIWNRPSPNEKRFNYCNETTKTTFLSTSESAPGLS